jgi:hypothetical protein
MPNDASSGPPALAASAVYSATLMRSTCGTKYSGSALSSTMTRTSSSDSSSPSSGPIRFIGGASITTPSTPSSLRTRRNVRYVWVIVCSPTPGAASKGTLTTDSGYVDSSLVLLIVAGALPWKITAKGPPEGTRLWARR